jgi:ubiquinone/menaquinone biosynthesis C-methylase UbiE
LAHFNKKLFRGQSENKTTTRPREAPPRTPVLDYSPGDQRRNGVDYLEWLKAGASATGVGLSSVSLEQARRRCESAGYRPDSHLADAEHLPFPDNTFDIVYSYGVIHHGPDTRQCRLEAWRVLKPGGKARVMRVMLYHSPIAYRAYAVASLRPNRG